MSSISNCKRDFPVLTKHKNLVYLDSTATTLKPQAVIDAERKYYEEIGATVHRGVYDVSVTATEAYEGVREKIRKFINAKSTKEIIFTKNATEAINLVSNTLSQVLPKGSVILTTEMEHHSNILPWRALQPWGFEVRYIPVDDNGHLDLSKLDELFRGVKLLAVTQMSNVLGTVNDVKMLAQKAHAIGAKILVDGAQSVPHMPVDVQDLDCDFLVFSAHKMLGPTGVGVLYAKEEILNQLPPFLRGGDMILEVTKDAVTWNELPYKFEAGTPNIAGVIGFGAAIDYLNGLGMENVWEHERELARYGLEQLKKIDGVSVLGASLPPGATPLEQGGAVGRGAIFSLALANIHPHDVGSILNDEGMAVRAGHHCAQVLHQRFNLPATTRASGFIYTTKQDIDALVQGLRVVLTTLG